MNGRIVELDASVHQKVEKLLPWLLVDALSEADLALVRGHLQVCKLCQNDLAWQRKLHSAQRPGVTGADVERAYAALRERLAPGAPAAHRRWLAWLRRPWQGGWMLWALRAQGVTIAALAAFVVTLLPAGAPAPYPARGAPPGARGNVVVMFQPTTTEQELRRILRGSGARIVDGPTMTGVYLLQVSDAQRGAGIAALRGEHAVVLAQSLDPEGRP